MNIICIVYLPYAYVTINDEWYYIAVTLSWKWKLSFRSGSVLGKFRLRFAVFTVGIMCVCVCVVHFGWGYSLSALYMQSNCILFYEFRIFITGIFIYSISLHQIYFALILGNKCLYLMNLIHLTKGHRLCDVQWCFSCVCHQRYTQELKVVTTY